MKLEATPGIEPGYADLQSAASPLRHVASMCVGSILHNRLKQALKGNAVATPANAACFAGAASKPSLCRVAAPQSRAAGPVAGGR